MAKQAPDTEQRPRRPLTAARAPQRALWLLAVSGLALAASPAQADELERLSKALSRIRGEVEALSDELRDLKEDERLRLRALAAQETDLELELKREELRLRQLQERKAALQKRTEALDEEARRLKPTALEALGEVRGAIESTLPFRLGERLKSIDELKRQLDEGLISPQQAIWRLWERVEDEARLARENSLHQQVIDLDGEQILADVARLGMAMMYFRTQDGRYGAVKRRQGQWTWVEITDKKSREQIAALFDALKKQIRVGFFELPSALPSEAP